MTTTTTKTGVATLKKLQKECLTIDLTKLRFKKGFRPPRQYLGIFDPNAPLTTDDVNTDQYGNNPHIKIGKGHTFNKDWGNHPDPNILSNRYRHTIYEFRGGKRGRSGEIHTNFTDTQILVGKSTDEILGVLYAWDNDYLNEWLRQTIDPNIPNNWDELLAEKEFEVLITTTTYSQEKVKVVGRTYDECVETMKQNDPMLNVEVFRTKGENLFSGMKTTSTREGAKPIPSSYEEWVSINGRMLRDG